MGGEYLSQCRSAVSYAEKMIAKEMQRIKEMEAKGLNPSPEIITKIFLPADSNERIT